MENHLHAHLKVNLSTKWKKVLKLKRKKFYSQFENNEMKEIKFNTKK